MSHLPCPQYVAACAFGLATFNNTDLALSAIAAYFSQCSLELMSNPAFYDDTSAGLGVSTQQQAAVALFCPNQCSYQGTCVDGVFVALLLAQ